MMNRIKRFLRRSDGTMSVMSLILLPSLFLVAGVAIDTALINYQRGTSQDVADLAALSAARQLDSVDETRAAVQKALDLNETFPFLEMQPEDIVLGWMDDDRNFVASDDQSSMTNVSAVKVRTASPAQFLLFRNLMPGDPIVLHETAIAENEALVSFALTNCASSYKLLDGLVSTVVDLDVEVLCSNKGLRVNTFRMLDRLANEVAAISPFGAPQTYGDVLDAQVSFSSVVAAATGQSATYTPDTVRLGEVLVMSDEMRNMRIGSDTPDIEVQAADVVFGSAEVLSQENAVDAEVKVDLGSMSDFPIRVTISEPRKVVIGATPGDPAAMAKTSQIRIEANGLQLGSALSLDMALNVANASARLSKDGEHCNADPNARAAVFDPVTSGLFRIELTFRIGKGNGKGNTDQQSLVLSDETGTVLEFTKKEVDQGVIKTYRPTPLNFVEELINTAISSIAQVFGGLGDSAAAGAFDALGNVASKAAAEMTGIGDILQDFFGLAMTEAQLEVLDISCSTRLAL